MTTTIPIEDWDETPWPPAEPGDTATSATGFPWRLSHVRLIADAADANERTT